MTDALPPGFKEHSIRVTVTNVSNVMVAKQLTEMKTGTAYIIKEVRPYIPGTVEIKHIWT